MQGLRDDLLAAAGAVDVRGVDEVHAELDGATEETDALLAIVHDAHRAEAEAAHLELAAELEARVHSRDTTCAATRAVAPSRAPSASRSRGVHRPRRRRGNRQVAGGAACGRCP